MTILFSDVVGFTNICSKIQPMEVVALLNNMYTKFDKLTEQFRVYKVRKNTPFRRVTRKKYIKSALVTDPNLGQFANPVKSRRHVTRSMRKFSMLLEIPSVLLH